jgi:hypothetical protein
MAGYIRPDRNDQYDLDATAIRAQVVLTIAGAGLQPRKIDVERPRGCVTLVGASWCCRAGSGGSDKRAFGRGHSC